MRVRVGSLLYSKTACSHSTDLPGTNRTQPTSFTFPPIRQLQIFFQRILTIRTIVLIIKHDRAIYDLPPVTKYWRTYYAGPLTFLPRSPLWTGRCLRPFKRQQLEPMARTDGNTGTPIPRACRRFLWRGQSPPWPIDRPVFLKDEVALLEPVFARAGDSFAMVGHFYGGGVALIAAVLQAHRVHALALYEPTLFSLLDAEVLPPNDADGIRLTVASAGAAIDSGDRTRAAECFINFWMGNGAWDRMPEAHKGAIASAMSNVRNWGKALFEEPTPLAAFSRLNIPVLYMLGKESPVASRGVGRLLTQTLPHVEIVKFDGIGHMGPISFSISLGS